LTTAEFHLFTNNRNIITTYKIYRYVMLIYIRLDKDKASYIQQGQDYVL